MTMTSARTKSLLLGLAAIAALAALLPAAAGAATGRTVAVTASATMKVPNDLATLGVGVKKERKTRSAALRAASVQLKKVIAAAQKIPGVGEGDVKTGRVDIHPTMRGKVTIYSATAGAKVTLHEPSKAGELVNAVVAAGANGISGPYFSVGNQEAAVAKVLGMAFEKAKQRATVLATQAGAHLGPALTIEEGNGEFVTRGGEFEGSFFAEEAAPVAAKQAPPTKPGKSTVKATVHVIFELT
jgi:uncharacterized protein